MAGWTPVPEAAASAWKPVVEAPKPAATHGDRLKGTPSGLPDTFMGTITKDFAAIPEGLYNTVTHPIDTVKGAFHQLVNLPGDVVTDISQGNWGKLAAKFGELAVPALSTERGAAMAGAAGTALKDAAAATASKAAEIAANPVARELIGIASPRLRNALSAVDRVKTAARKAAAENEATAAAEAPVAAPPVEAPAAPAVDPALEALAQQSGFESFEKAPQIAQVALKNKLQADAELAAKKAALPQQPNPPMGPQAAPAEAAPAAPAGPSRTLAQQLADDVAAHKQASASPDSAPIEQSAPPEMIGAHQVTPLESGKGVPLRPPIRRAPLPTETRAQYEAAMQSSPQSAPITTAVPEPEALAPPPRSLVQTEAAMGQKKPTTLEEPRSRYNADGSQKSQQQRNAEITQFNTLDKAKRFAEAFNAEGITSEDVGNMTPADARAMTNGLIAKGALKAGEVPPDTSMPHIVKLLKELERGKDAPKPAAKVTPISGPLSKNAKALEIARQLAEEMAK